MSFEKPGDLTQHWKQRVHFLGLAKKQIEVHAWQEEVNPPFMPGASTAKLTITVDGKVELEDEIPWPLPNGNLMLALQVFLLSKMPDYAYAEWQPVMERFARRCEGFAEPSKIWWGAPNIL